MTTNLQKNHHPDFKKWNSYYIYCVKKKFNMNDDTVQYVFGFTINTQLEKLDKEYHILANALAREDGDFLNRFFSSFGFEEIRIEFDSNYYDCDDLKVEIEGYYTGEKWGLVNDFSINVWDYEKSHFLEGERDEFYFLEDYPIVLADALNFFNALSFENTTHLIKLHSMWNQLNEIRNLCFKIPQYDEDDHKLFVVSNLFSIHPKVTKNLDRLIKKINFFQNTYQIDREDYFGFIKEYAKPEGRIHRWYKNAFEGYLGKILKSYFWELRTNRLVSECQRCGNVFKFSKTKKYCSIAQNGQDCAKIARNRRFYYKHRDEILPKAQINTKELRAFYKERGIKK